MSCHTINHHFIPYQGELTRSSVQYRHLWLTFFHTHCVEIFACPLYSPFPSYHIHTHTRMSSCTWLPVFHSHISLHTTEHILNARRSVLGMRETGYHSAVLLSFSLRSPRWSGHVIRESRCAELIVAFSCLLLLSHCVTSSVWYLLLPCCSRTDKDIVSMK